MTTYESWSLGVAVVAVAVNAAIFVFFGFQLHLLREQIRQAAEATERDHAQRRGEATLNFVTATMDRMAEFRRQGLPELVIADVEPFIDAPHDFDDDRNKLIRDYLNSMEALADGVNLGIYDVAVVAGLRGTIIVRTWEMYRPWIEARRELLDIPTLYEQLHALSDRVRGHYAKTGRPPIAIV